MRTWAWLAYLKAATGESTAYALGKLLDKEFSRLFSRYEKGDVAPTSTTLKLAEKEVPGSRKAYDIGPYLPGDSDPIFSLWTCLSASPHELSAYLVANDDQFAEMHAEGASFKTRFEAIGANFLTDEVDGVALLQGGWLDGSAGTSLEERLDNLLTLPGQEYFLNEVAGGSVNGYTLYCQNAAIAKGDERKPVANELADLLSVPLVERNQFIKEICALDHREVFNSVARLFNALLRQPGYQKPAQPKERGIRPRRINKSADPLIRRLEQSRLVLIKGAGWEINKLAALTALWRISQASGDWSYESGMIFHHYNRFLTHRLLTPYDIANEFIEYIELLDAENEAATNARLEKIPLRDLGDDWDEDPEAYMKRVEEAEAEWAKRTKDD